LPTAAEATPRQLPPRLPAQTVFRELARIGVAFVLYLVLRGLWVLIGLDRFYNSLVLEAAEWVFVRSQHFPVVPDLKGLSLTQLDFLVVFAISLFAVSTGMPWRRRLKRFAAVLAVIYVLHVISILLQVRLISARDMNERYGLLLLLPLEFEVVDHLKYLLYDLGLQWGPFLLALLTVLWNTHEPPARGPRIPGRVRRRLWVSGALVVGLLATGTVWVRWRESHPLHVDAHATMGVLLHNEGDIEEAERHYRIAIDGGTRAPQAYLYLAAIRGQRGDRREAIDLLRQGQRVAPDEQWASRFEEAIEELRHSAP
jgi:hypothetical protein